MKEVVELDISLVIAEDRNLSRKYFKGESLRDLATSIQKYGVMIPISVYPDKEGHYIINHGVRRYKASLIAGNSTIPAFIDDDYNLKEDISTKIQKDLLTVREIVDVISRYRNHGMPNKDIATLFKKSKAWVSSYFALVDAPEPIAMLIVSGKYTDTTMLAQLARLYEKDKKAVTEFIENNDYIKRNEVTNLKNLLENSIREESSSTVADEKFSGMDYGLSGMTMSYGLPDSSFGYGLPESETGCELPPVIRKMNCGKKTVKFKVRYHGEVYELCNKVPSNKKSVWICNCKSGDTIEVNINEVELEETSVDDN